VSKLGGETPSWIRAYNLIHKEKQIVLFDRNCHVTEKSEAIACARRCRSMVNRVVDPK
jgi:arginine/lysine/ornithine decarboxylase